MPEPKSPVIRGLEKYEVVYGAAQPEYIPLPSLRSPDGRVMSRWQFTEEERKQIADGADLLLTIHTFNQPYPPTQVAIGRVGDNPAFHACQLCIDAYFNDRRQVPELPSSPQTAAQEAA